MSGWRIPRSTIRAWRDGYWHWRAERGTLPIHCFCEWRRGGTRHCCHCHVRLYERAVAERGNACSAPDEATLARARR